MFSAAVGVAGILFFDLATKGASILVPAQGGKELNGCRRHSLPLMPPFRCAGAVRSATAGCCRQSSEDRGSEKEDPYATASLPTTALTPNIEMVDNPDVDWLHVGIQKAQV